MNLSVVIPAYNEEANIEKAVLDVIDKLPDSQIIVVNDASTDATGDILDRLVREYHNLEVITNKMNMGHGFSVRRGLDAAQGDSILYIDADRQIALSNLKQLDGMKLGDFDVISGWRIGRKDKLFRKITSFFLKMTIYRKYGYFIRDANCPFKLYRRDAIRGILTIVPDTNIIPIACIEVLARKHGYRTMTIETPHKAYDGVREGFLQFPNRAFFEFVKKAYKEIINL
jgi:glycosyltransferase involved in cell wall biosynthesis